MRVYEGQKLYSASDLVSFLGCTHATTLDLNQLIDPVEFPPADAQTVLLQKKGIEHEQAYLERLRAEGLSIVEISSKGSLEVRADQTVAAMQSGADVVYQGALLSAPWHGYSDFLLKVDSASTLGSWSYDVADTKLARHAKPSHILQLCVYADLIASVQGVPPQILHVVLGAGGHATIRASSVQHYYSIAKQRFEEFVVSSEQSTSAEPCGHCTYCRWSSSCEAQWEKDDHLSLVAGISRGQIAKLRAANIPSLRALAQTAAGLSGHGINAETFSKLRAQASLQLVRRDTGKGKVEALPLVDGKGFNRLPRPNPGDLFFDMEGDPLLEERLEYLFGFIHVEDGKERFTPFWAHDQVQEKIAFEAAIDFITSRLAAYPEAHIYHYASYEVTALKRLAMFHGTRESAVDDLLRQARLVDLYQVVRESIRTSESGYSIKDLEVFYLDGGRGGEVKTASDSIVVYENWRVVQDPALLQEIADYNELDCRSTRLCRDWLLHQRPSKANWRAPGESTPPTPEKIQERNEAEARTQALAAALVQNAPEADRPWRELLSHLLEFHRREAKPSWWAMFARMEMTDQELLDDAECLSFLSADQTRPPRADKRSKIYSFKFPAQDFKLKAGDSPLLAASGKAAGEITFIDEAEQRVELKLGPTRDPIQDGASLIPAGPIADKQLRDAVYRYAECIAAGDNTRYTAVTDILMACAPRISKAVIGEPLIQPGTEVVEGTVEILQRLQNSYLLIQGPPGAGKTYTSSHAIAALLSMGARIGVASNSHKAINNILAGVQKACDEAGILFRGIKKSSNEDQFITQCPSIENTTDNKLAVDSSFQLHAGTAWLFARPELDDQLDYLFIDEAGQVSLANVVAMGVSTKNIILVGDQMQLSQPIQGDHPSPSGLSALAHLMGEHATVPPNRGVFLSLTRRMHPDICKFISDAVYDGRLQSHGNTAQQRLTLPPNLNANEISATGLRFRSITHADRSQKSPEEVAKVVIAYNELLKCGWINDKGVEHPITSTDILVVSPYNMQVELLRSSLPVGARVGTVDKFQGQEAAVVLISMATSSGEDLPRNIEFLYSRNRLNVAISRARCLAVIYANPRLLEITCSTISQMQLVNTLCWAKAYADSAI